MFVITSYSIHYTKLYDLLGSLWLIIGICMTELHLREERPPMGSSRSPATTRRLTAALVIACASYNFV